MAHLQQVCILFDIFTSDHNISQQLSVSQRKLCYNCPREISVINSH